MSFNKDERVKIWADIKGFCSEESQQVCDDKLQELFRYGYYDMYFERLSDLCYTLEPYTKSNNDSYLQDMDSQKVIFVLLDAFIAYEYFNKHIKDKGHYDYTKLVKKFEDIQPFLVSESKITINVPFHPNCTYNDALHSLIEDCGLDREIVTALLNTLFDIEKKPPQTMQVKREMQGVFNAINEIIDILEKQGHSEEAIEEAKAEIIKLKKYF